jgi:ferredoxin-NADP reductase
MSLERTLTVRVERILRETPEILAFELAHPWGRTLPGYEAGAHIDVHCPAGFRASIRSRDGLRMRRRTPPRT